MARRLKIKWAPDSAVAAKLEMPSHPAAVGVLLAHGAGAGQDHPFMAHIRSGLAAAGYPTLTFDYSYMDSGRKAPDRHDKLLAVHQAAAHRLTTYVDRVVIAGKSMGGRIGSHLVGDLMWPAAGVVYYAYPLVPLGKGEPRPTDHLNRIVVPQLFFAGTRDRLSPPPAIAALVDSMPAAELRVIEEGDHSFSVPKRSGRRQSEVLDDLVSATAVWIRRLG